MLEAEFFSERKVIWAKRNFISPETCREIVADMEHNISIEAETYDSVKGVSVSKDRKTRQHRVSVATYKALEDRLHQVQPEIGEFFGHQLSSIEMLQFLRYEVGYYFKPHRDKLVPAAKTARLVTFVLFLNDQLSPEQSLNLELAHGQAGFKGGSLVLYGGMGKSPGKLGLPLKAEAGLLIAFNPAIVHEVRPVEAGTRYTVISWFG